MKRFFLSLLTIIVAISANAQVRDCFQDILPVTDRKMMKSLNGQPIKLRGVTCHSTDPKMAKIISDELTLKDMRLMKEASINYIRTSHYPREPRFYELADRGIVLTYNAAVSGEGPKFARTAFPVIANKVGTVSGDFYLYRIDKTKTPQLLSTLFAAPAAIPAPFRPYATQYDTYLMRLDDITDGKAQHDGAADSAVHGAEL